MKKRVLIVEDGQALAKVLCDNLTLDGYDVEHVANGDLALDRVRGFGPDLVVLDIMLPGMNGLDLCDRLWHHGHTPVLMFTGSSRHSDKVEALDRGADDYITKPLALGEFLARVRAVLRRALLDSDSLRIGPLTINFAQRLALRGATTLHLTEREFCLLQYLSERMGHVVHREELLHKFWSTDMLATRSVDIAIARLRKKIEPDAHRPRFIHTVHGDGYTLTPPRVRAVLPRTAPSSSSLVMGNVTIHFLSRTARRGRTELYLTHREFELLRYLAERPGRIVHRDELLRDVWGYLDAPLTRSVDNAILRLRRKIEPDVHNPRYIHTIVGDGYSLTPQG